MTARARDPSDEGEAGKVLLPLTPEALVGTAVAKDHPYSTGLTQRCDLEGRKPSKKQMFAPGLATLSPTQARKRLCGSGESAPEPSPYKSCKVQTRC